MRNRQFRDVIPTVLQCETMHFTNRKMKILLLGEYSNVHATLALGLRKLGHDVTVISNGDFWKDYPRDIDVSRKEGKAGGIMLYLKILTLLPRMTGYDIVQLINPMFFELKAERLFHIYRFLKKHNRKIVLGAYGMDYYWVKTCTEDKPLRYSDFNIGGNLRTDAAAVHDRQDWIGTPKGRLNVEIAHSCDGIITGLYEYDVCYRHVFPHKTRFIPFPIVVPDTNPHNLEVHRPLRLFIGISKQRSAYKGTDIMLSAAEAVKEKYPELIELQVANGIPFAEYSKLLDGSDVIMDQLYSYTPAMNALLAMSKGIVVIGGGESENYEIIHEDRLRPIINVQPSFQSVYEELERLVLSPSEVMRLKAESIKYVRKHHDYIKVARQYLGFYGEI